MPNSQTRKSGKMPGVEIDPSSTVESVNVNLNSRQIRVEQLRLKCCSEHCGF